jgi:hypothetical protein
MWESLRSFPEFSLTHGVSGNIDFGSETPNSHKIFESMESEINRIYNYTADGIWLSGDYTAATDNLPMWVSQALMEGILEHIDHEPTKRWARYEVGPHQLEYPDSSGIPSGIQNSGQLMGSLLSFPLLCLANAFIVEYSGIEPGTFLVNGDDIVAYTSHEAIERWKVNAPRIGLSLSLGKNFIDKTFCTVNSQLFVYDSEVDQMTIRHTGKVSLLRRNGGPLGDTFADFQKFYGYEDIFRCAYIRENFLELQNTPCNLSIPRSHGGLGSKFLFGRKVNQKLGKEVYFATLWKKVFPKAEKDFAKFVHFQPIYAPYLELEDDKVLAGLPNPNQRVMDRFRSLLLPKLSVDDESYGSPELTIREHRNFLKLLNSESSNWKMFRDIINDTSIMVHDLPDLESVKIQLHFVQPEFYKLIQERLLYQFITNFRQQVRLKDPLGFSTWYNTELTAELVYNLSEPDLTDESELTDEPVLTDESAWFRMLHSLFDEEEPLLDPVQMREDDSRLKLNPLKGEDKVDCWNSYLASDSLCGGLNLQQPFGFERES